MRISTLWRWIPKLFRKAPPATPAPFRRGPVRVPALPPMRRIDTLAEYGQLPPAVLAARKHYLEQLGTRTDSLLDGLIGMDAGWSGGGWKNPVTGHGTFARDKVMQGHYSEPYRLSDPELAALYNGNDLAKRIVDTVPREMFRRGWVLVVPQDLSEDADGEDTSAASAEQPTGGESGPAAPGAPLIDPMGAAPDNQKANVPADDGAGAEGDEAKPTTNEQVAPAAEKAEDTDVEGGGDPTGERLAKAAQPPDQEQRDPEAGKIPAGNKGATDQPKGATDQPKGADLAKAGEAYAARLMAKERLLEASIFGRNYGGGLLIVGADDGQDMSQPLKEAEIKSIRYLTWIDRRFIFANTWYAEIGPKYGEVATWQIVNPFGGQSNTVIHESRVIRFDGAPVDFLMRRRLLGWTLSVLQAPYDTMRQFDLSFQSIANLMADMSQAVMKIQDLAQLIANDQQTLNTRMQMVDMSRSSSRMLYVDAENEDFTRTATPLTGVADTIEMQMLRLAAAAEMPVAILFGREPSGLNATGDADFRRFYDVIKGKQLTELEPKLRRLYTLIFAAKDGPTGGQVPKQGIEFVWHKLYEPSELEQSEIRWNMAQADEKYVVNKILLPEEVAKSRFRNGDLNLDTEIRTDLRDESLATAQLPLSGKAADDEQAKQAKDMAAHQADVKGQAAIAVKGASPGKDPNKAPPKPGGGGHGAKRPAAK